MAEEHLSTLDLVSLLAGYLSLGCSLWSAFPQIYLLASFPPTGGPLVWMLVIWLLGDAMQVSGMYMNSALDTQKLSGIWFGISDIIIMLEMAIGRGWLPGTPCWARRKQIKTHMPLSVGEDQGNDKEDVGYGPTPVAVSAGSTRSPVLKRLRRFIGRWMPDFDGTRANAVVLVMLVVVGVGCWAGLDVVRRKEKEALRPGEPPHSVASWIGWSTAMAGMVCYISPRIAQILKIRRDQSMENTSVWMFGWLLGQNYTMLVSILAVSHTPDAMYGQAPFLINTIAALTCDHVVRFRLVLSLTFPTHLCLNSPYRTLRPHSASRPRTPSPTPSHGYDASYTSTEVSDDDESDRGRHYEHLKNEAVAREHARQDVTRWIKEFHDGERRRLTHGNAEHLSPLQRRALARRLDAQAKDLEDRVKAAMSDLGDQMSSADEDERHRHAEWAKKMNEELEKARAERVRRRNNDAEAEQRLKKELESYKVERRRRGWPMREDEGGAPSTSSEDSWQDERSLSGRTSRRRVSDPRRGVGTA
ncbi:hypothetical protein JCM3770_005001 [Rhodotorula araucariae]